MAEFTDIPYPSADADAANKKYVDDQSGGGIPTGGTTGQQLTKTTNTDFDVEWAAAGGSGVPTGGTTGQQLTKVSNADFDVDWEAAGGGTGTGFQGVNHQTGTSYFVDLINDNQKLITLKNASPVSVVLGPGGYSRVLTINHTLVPSTQTNFPVLVSLTDATLKTVSNGGHVQNSNGFDIRFYSDATGATKLKWEMERYNPATGEVVAWVKIASVSSTVDTVFYLFYGNPAITTDQSDKINVWTNAFTGVFHLANGTTLSTASSSSVFSLNNNNAVSATAGWIDGAANFASASAQSLEDPSAIFDTPAKTFSAWVKAATLPGAYNGIVGKGSGGIVNEFLYVKSNGKLNCKVNASGTPNYDGTGSHTLVTGTWYHVAYTYDSTSGLIGYVNGASDATVAPNGPILTAGISMYLGGARSLSLYWNGQIDEAHYANVARSASWLATEYNNQSAPGTFLSVGAENSGVSISKCVFYFENLGSGIVTISATDSLVDDAGFLDVPLNNGVMIACDGSSYYTCRGMSGTGGPGPTGEQLADSYDHSHANYDDFEDRLCPDVTFGVLGVGQSLTAAVGGNITRARVFLKRFGSPTGNAVAKLYAHSGTYGTSSVPGTLLATSDNLNVATVSTSGAYYDFPFSTTYLLVAATRYVITIEYSGTDINNCIGVAGSRIAAHSGNEMGLHTSTWSADAAEDLIFYVYVH